MTILFDMDGTLFAGDSQLRFARWVLRRHGWRRLYLLPVLPGLVLCGLKLLSLERMKRLFLIYAWGMRREVLEAECRAFVEQELLPAVYEPVLARLRAHQAAGHTTILCSASPDWWAPLVGQALGFERTISTPVPTGRRVPLMPAIPAPGNNRAAAKLTRLAAVGITHAHTGYTDSTADLPMLSICRHAVLVNPAAKLCRQAPQGAEIIRTPQPNRLRFVLSCLLGW
ncbi:MAG: HAD-IB family phosphatase [Akkermansiaceae bacterium]|nr:HAD-IB family phosphatase [Akkermansiaceae bacterium]